MRTVYLDEGIEPGEGTCVLEFRLTWQGRLTSTRTPPDGGDGTGVDLKAANKHEIRRHFHKQLVRYCKAHWAQSWLWHNEPDSQSTLDKIGDKFKSNNFRWVPLLRSDGRILCSLDVLYLREGKNRTVVADSDIDNRIKTVIDALKIPKLSELPSNAMPEPDEDPFFVLLESDELITRLTAEADLLLDPTDPKLGSIDSRVVVSVKTWQG